MELVPNTFHCHWVRSKMSKISWNTCRFSSPTNPESCSIMRARLLPILLLLRNGHRPPPTYFCSLNWAPSTLSNHLDCLSDFVRSSETTRLIYVRCWAPRPRETALNGGSLGWLALIALVFSVLRLGTNGWKVPRPPLVLIAFEGQNIWLMPTSLMSLDSTFFNPALVPFMFALLSIEFGLLLLLPLKRFIAKLHWVQVEVVSNLI